MGGTPGATGGVLRRSTALALVAGTLLGVATPGALAGPEGAQVVRGNVTIRREGALTTITAPRNSIINYRSFDIAPHETVRFIQPDAASRVLNRIQGPAPTRIDGTLLANGRVYIVNPAGVIFGAGSVVNAGGIFAAAGTITDRDFLRGVDRVSNVQGGIVAEGLMDVGSATLVGRRIEQSGTIVADAGVVAMLVGSDVTVRESGGRISARIDGADVTASSDAAARPGKRQGLTSLGAGDAVSLAFRNTGHVRASGGTVLAATPAGRIENTGTIDTSVHSGQAGTVVVTGAQVATSGRIASDADAGRAGAVEVTSSSRTTLASGAVVSASGGDGHADGGRVLVHAYHGDTVVQRGARVDLSGGARGGDGGTGEVSGAQRLAILGDIVGNAAPGFAPATILLDPRDILIRTPGAQDAQVADGVVLGAEGGTDDWVISPGAIEGFAGDVRLEATRDITIFEDINKANGGLTLLAGRDINFGDPLMLNLASREVRATSLDFRAGRHIAENMLFGTTLRASTGDIALVATTGNVGFSLAGVPSGRTISITQDESRMFGAGPFGIIENPGATNIVLNVTDGHLVIGGDYGGVSGYQNIGSLDAFASEYVRIEDNLDIGSVARIRSEGNVVVAGFVHAGERVELHAATGGTGTLSFQMHLEPGMGVLTVPELWAPSIALRAGSNSGLGAARVDALTTTPIFRGASGGATRPDAFEFAQDAAVFESDRPALAQFGAPIDAMAYRVESFDQGVSVTNTNSLDATALTLASETGSTVSSPLTLVSLDTFGPVLLRADVTATAHQTYNDAVVVNDDRTLTGTTITFRSSLDAAEDPGHDCGDDLGDSPCPIPGGLTLLADAVFDAPVGQAHPLEYLLVQRTSAINGGLIRTGGDQRFDGAVTLGSFAILESTYDPTPGTIRFGSTLDGAHVLEVLTTPAGVIVFNGDVGASEALTEIFLSTAFGTKGRDIPDRATIVGERSISIRAANFTMSQHEKFTTLGSLTLQVDDLASLGDMTTVGDLTITATTTRFNRREASDLLLADGSFVTDRGLDLVAGGQLVIEGNVVLAGSGPDPTFSDIDGVGPASLADLEFTQTPPEDVTLDALQRGGVVLDQRTRPAAPPPPPPPP
ncbi:MAG: filamentous hemagglutinin N-terminal domain-containing protein, partial [Planctomycetota bacterium]|nr:filamentous hemagglutinin N-terminal domain-containing protein [Planctomycetota bacterium]